MKIISVALIVVVVVRVVDVHCLQLRSHVLCCLFILNFNYFITSRLFVLVHVDVLDVCNYVPMFFVVYFFLILVDCLVISIF
jgi:hypothetical protein